MISRWLLLTLFTVALAPGLLHAQQAYPNAQKQRVELRFTLTETVAAQNEKMYEDIEILRRILARKLTSLYPAIPSKGVWTKPSGSGTPTIDASTGMLYFTPDGKIVLNERLNEAHPDDVSIDLGFPYFPYPATIPFSSLEGVYIKGQGVVYTATLSSLQVPAKAEADSTVNQLVRSIVVSQDTEWDSIRRQVRNEKEEPKKPEANKPPSLSDLLLKVLAENGHHFSQLGENETLTIVLTVHEAIPSSSAAKPGTGSAQSLSKPTPAGNDADARREAGNLAMLGELHLKQAKYGEALSIFQKMLGLAKTPQQEADVRSLLAQCYLRQGQVVKARAELDKAVALIQKQKEAKEIPAAKPAALPVKLIVSASKKLLDQIKDGKISFEEFRRQASVETLRFGDRR